ncbi:hypothetical protein KFK09_006714 [Dendrobium nobile]|uniref:SWIM-type domain-containing protein n=1 Tax=Dendrobium nobile TaxID=94219 RepID=A0A8T3BQ09_DENNO|nr:hypothetical protein KFK09_006714 [Dendrobium nobile]
MQNNFEGQLSLSDQPNFMPKQFRPHRSVTERPIMVRESNSTFQETLVNSSYVPQSELNENVRLDGGMMDNDDVGSYETMDSGSSDSGDGYTEPAPNLYGSINNNSNDESIGVELIEDHARRNVAGVESMEADNNYRETIGTSEQWDRNDQCDPPVPNIVSSNEAGIPFEIYEGQIFHNKEDLQAAINGWSISQNVEYVNSTSNKSRLSILCSQHNNMHRACSWRLHASRSKRLGGLWKVSSVGPPHCCTQPIMLGGHHNCTSKFICRHIMPIIKQQLDMKPKEVIARIESKFEMKISYMKAWDARRKAIESIFGSYEESYRSILRFMEAIRLTQPGTVYNIEMVGGSRFKALFWAFGPSISGWQYCRPVLSLDGTFLLGKYRGTLLVAVGIDGNGGLFPLAFAVVESESNESWVWFLKNLHDLVDVVKLRQNLCIISDKHPGLVRGCREIFPNAVHRHCLRHLRENYKKFLRRKAIPDVEGLCSNMYLAGSTDDIVNFTRLMNHIKNVKQEAYDWLIERDVSKWSLLFDNGYRYSIMTTNASECFNGVLKRARGLPIQGLVMSIYYNLVSLFVRRSTDVEKWVVSGESEFVLRTMDTLQRTEREARRCPQPITINRGEFEVVDSSCRPHRVEIPSHQNCTCTCKRPQLYHVPCVHVIAVAGYRRWNHNSFVSQYFTLNSYRETYSGLFHVLPPKEVWPNFCEVQGIIPLLAPAFRRRAGRPRTNRFRNTMDEPNSTGNKRCGHCKQNGHNRATCPNNPGSSRYKTYLNNNYFTTLC